MNRFRSEINHFVRYVAATVAILCFLAAVACCAAAPTSSSAKPASLLCDSLKEPLGIDSVRPVLSWKLQDDRRGAKQTAYEILVSSKPAASGSVTPDVWDSGSGMPTATRIR